MADRPPAKLGFVGLGVMGEPMCRNLARKSGREVLGFDRAAEPLRRLHEHGVEPAPGIAALAQDCGVIFMALPSGRHVQAVCEGPDGLLAAIRPGTLVVDLGTSPVDLTRDLADHFRERGARYADAPIARTRQAAEDGTLSIMVGAEPADFAELHPLLATLATDITHCGPVGSGQIVKILNNMVLVETVVALSEAIAVARRAGLDGQVLFETLQKGSADSFALRNHGMKAILPGRFPERAFSTDYARKDLSYALSLGSDLGLDLRGARTADDLLRQASEAGYGDLYWPVVSRILDPKPNEGGPGA
ncbi:NAD(P)-dependent oxidoreductase [Enterovirga aerilata]|uniref:NAD(P)-dependent oxidoreductase n=1 Tax=Enterovirga aerilata TaxID=2730920 RepID=A0A849ILT4_9HYPH|nr:NAD(P)-dependent oxidoreductase [Enterovirga sp. DB1703]NNM74913.1 NAD(P)-dependent oxidoreductase [Enterovirga sp. DB1703]